LSATSKTGVVGSCRVTQPKISALLHGRLDGFSMDRLVRFLNALDQDVKISVRPKAKAHPIVKVA